MIRQGLATLVALLVVSTVAVGPAAAASVSITDVSIPNSVTQGDSFDVDVDVSGSDVQNVQASLSVPDGLSCSPSGSQAVGLDGGSGQATFECDADAAGDYTGEITASVTADESDSSNTRSDSTQTGLDVLSPASLSLTTSIGSTDLDEGDTTTVDAVVHNSGDESTSYTVSIGDSSGYSATATSDSTAGTVDGGETKTISYDVTADSSGEYDLAVNTDGGNGQSLSESHTLSISAPSSGGSASSDTVETATEAATATPEQTPEGETETPTATAEPTDTDESGQTATDAAESTQSPVAETAAEADDTAAATDGDPEPTAGSGPGFGVLATLGALLAAAILATRHE